jgi:UDP-glucose 4-epimerase
MAKVLITGGAGFIGSHLTQRCVTLGLQTTVIDNLQSGSYENLAAIKGELQFIEGNLQEAMEQKLDLASFDVVFHLAANAYVPPSVERPMYDYEHNLKSTFCLLERIRTSSRKTTLIYTSSAAVYGDPVRFPIIETDLTEPISPYGVSKLAAERYVAVYSHLYQIPAASLRLFSVYGPRQRKQVIYDLMSKVLKEPKQLTVLGNGQQERDFVFVDNVVDAFLLVWQKAPKIGEVYNVASGESVSIAQLVTHICQTSQTEPHIEFTGKTRPGDADRWVVDTTKLQTLGYTTTVNLQEGLERTYQWLRTQPL